MARPGLVLQNDADVPPALLADWLDAREIAWRLVDVPREGVPDLRRAPWVTVLGSRESTRTSSPAWISEEIEALRLAADRAPTLGICFGGQALSLSLGGRVRPAPLLEAGWDERIEVVDDEVPRGPWLNFHRESFTLPPRSRLLARSRAGPAAFRRGPHLGLQFHPEATPEIAAVWAERYRSRHLPDLDLDALAAAGERHRADAARRAFRLFDAWWERT